MIFRRLFAPPPEPEPLSELPPLDPRVIETGIEDLQRLLTWHWRTNGRSTMLAVIPPGADRDGSWIAIDLLEDVVSAFASTIVGRGPLTAPELDVLRDLGFTIWDDGAYMTTASGADDPEAIRAIATSVVRAMAAVYRPHFPQPWDPRGRFDIMAL